MPESFGLHLRTAPSRLPSRAGAIIAQLRVQLDYFSPLRKISLQDSVIACDSPAGLGARTVSWQLPFQIPQTSVLAIIMADPGCCDPLFGMFQSLRSRKKKDPSANPPRTTGDASPAALASRVTTTQVVTKSYRRRPSKSVYPLPNTLGLSS